MAEKIGDAEIVIGADTKPFKRELEKGADGAGKDYGSRLTAALDKSISAGFEKSGNSAAASFVRGTDGRLRDLDGKFVSAAQLAAKGFVKGVDGELRDSDGQLVEVGDQAGKKVAKGLSEGFKDGFNKTAMIATLSAAFSGLGPVIAASSVAVVGLAGALGSAGAALGVFGAVGATAFKSMQEQAEELQKLREKADAYGLAAEQAQARGDTAAQTSALENQKMALDQVKMALSNMSPEQRKAYDGYEEMKGAWQGFVDANSSTVYGAMSQGFKLLTDNVGALQPLYDVGAKAVQSFLDATSKWVDNGGLKGLIDYLTTNAAVALPVIGSILANLGSAFGNLFGTFTGEGQGILTWLDNITEKFATLTASGGFNTWAGELKGQIPQLTGILGSLASSIGTIATALTPFAPLSLAVAGALGRIVAAIPPDWITAIVAGFVAYSIAMKAYAAYTAVATAAQWAMNSAILANPLTWIIALIVALVAVIVVIATKTTWFQTIWNTAWSGIQAVIQWFISWIGPAWDALWEAIKTTVSVVITAITAYINAYKAVVMAIWNAISAAAKRVWEAIKVTVSVVVSAIKAYINAYKTVVLAVWNAIKTAASTVWNSIKSIVSGVVNAIKGYVNAFKLVASTAFAVVKSKASEAFNSIKGVVSTVTGAVKNAWNTAKTAVIKAVSTAVSKAKTEFNKIKDAILSIDLAEAGRKLIGSLTRGITDAMSGPVNAVKNGLGKIKGLLPGSPIKWGPLKNWNNGAAGQRLMGLVASGITSSAGKVAASAASAMTRVAAASATGNRTGAKTSPALAAKISSLQRDGKSLTALTGGKKTTAASSSSSSGLSAASSSGVTYDIENFYVSLNGADITSLRKLLDSVDKARATVRKVQRSGTVKA